MTATVDHRSTIPTPNPAVSIEDVIKRSRAASGVPEKLTDPVTLARLATIFRRVTP